jgi:uncharacterized protein (DUF1330 family)
MAYGYIIANVNVTNPEQYEEYKKFSTLAMQKHGAELLTRGGRSELLEGNLHSRVVILKFPSFEAAQNFNNSAEYQLAKSKRIGAADMNMMVVEGI